MKLLGKPSKKKNGKKKGTLSTRGGGSTPVPFFCPNLPKFIGSSNHPEINSNTLEIQFFVTFFCHRPFWSPMIQWVQGVWFLIILRAFYIKMLRVPSRIYALLSVIRQQMSPFDPFRGGLPKGDNVPFFYRFFYAKASLKNSFFLSKLVFSSEN